MGKIICFGIAESGSPVMSPTTDTASVSSESDISQSEPISIGKVLQVVTLLIAVALWHVVIEKDCLYLGLTS